MFEQFVRFQKSPNTQDVYRRNLAQFEEFLGADKLAELEPKDLLAFQVFLKEEGYATTSRNQKLSTLKSFLKYAAAAGAVRPEVYAAALVVASEREDETLPKVLTQDEEERLKFVLDPAALSGARMLAYIEFSLATGCRLSEVVGVNVEHIDWRQRKLKVLGKGAKERYVRFGQAAAEALVAYLSMRQAPTQGPLFTNDEGGRISPRYFQAELRRCGEKAGVEGLHPHVFRHTFATRFLDENGDIHALAALLGHADIRTTSIYTKTATKRIDRIYDEFDAAQQERQPTTMALMQKVVAG